MWKVVYKGAYNPDGSLFFPEKLSHEFLESSKRAMGSYIFANQYLNEIVPSDRQTFKRIWFKYHQEVPKRHNTFVFIDPALSEADTSDFTGILIVKVDVNGDWHIVYAKRHRLNPTELVQFIFRINEEWHPQVIGVEEIAYQKAILYFLAEEMRRRKIVIPVTGIKYAPDKSKQTRILSLVPRFEWGHIFLGQGLTDLEIELLQFPRGSHDDLIDALASMEYIAFKPDEREELIKKPHSPHDVQYEQWYRQNRLKGGQDESDDE
jgi:predicted phage terminase large subunit-like protein